MALECPVCLNSLLEPMGGPSPAAEGCESRMAGADVIPIEAGAGSKRGGRRGGRAGSSRLKPVSATSATPCGHIFHTTCLNNWMLEAVGRPTCPTCRNAFTKGRILSVYLNASESSNDVEPTLPNTPSHSPAGNDDLQILAATAISPYTGTDFNFLNTLHNTLINDFNSLNTKYCDLRDEYDFSRAQNMSLEQELQCLQATLDGRINAAGTGRVNPTTSSEFASSDKSGTPRTRKYPQTSKRGRLS